MEEKQKYQNIHTMEVWTLDHIEKVENKPEPITVYVFENGERWCAEQLFAHWRKL